MSGALPSLDQLLAFVEAASTLNFREAARRTHCSPAAFSARVQGLEEALGATLFTRTTRQVALTPAGERLLPVALRCLETAAACADAVRERPVERTLTLGTRFELGLSWLVPGLEVLRQTDPGRTLNLVFGDSPELLERARRDEIDAVITSYRLRDRELVGVTLHPETYVFVAAPSALPPAGVQGPLDVADLALLDASADLPLFRYLMDARGEQAWPFRRRELLGSIGAIRMRALQGAGLAVLPRYFVERDLAEGRLVRLLADTPMVEDQFRLVWRAGHPRASELLALAQDLRALPLR